MLGVSSEAIACELVKDWSRFPRSCFFFESFPRAVPDNPLSQGMAGKPDAKQVTGMHC